MYREHGKSIDDVYENDFATKGKFGRQTMDSNTTRIQSSKRTGRTQRMDTGTRQSETEDIYENADALKGKMTMETKDSNTRRIQPPEHTGSDCVKVMNYRAAVVCLVLLCVLLLTAVIVLCVTLTQERQQLISKNENLTNERDHLILKNTNLTNEREQLILKNTNLTNELQICVEWICYQSTCYYISNETKNWTESRQDCLKRGADLIIINNSEEQDFVNNMSGVAAVYIGLTDIDMEGTWKWVDGSNMTSGFMVFREPAGGISENCAVTVAVSRPEFGNLEGWHDVLCTDVFQWICEKRISQFILP